MPYKSEYTKMKIKREDNRAIKLSPEQRIEIKQLYTTGLYSQRGLAKKFNVSRRTVVYCIYPEKYEKNREQFKERQKTGIYYDKEKQRVYSQRTRQHRKELYKEGKLEK